MKIKISLAILLIFSLYGCNDSSDQVEVRIEPDFYENPWTDEIQSRSLIIVTTLSDEPIEIQNISVNRGGCTSQMTQGAKILSRYGSYTKFLLPNCDISMVKEAQLKLNNLEYVYNF